MADYFTPTVIQPTIPAAEITPLERLLLSHIFHAEPDGERLYFFADEGPCDMIWIDRAPIETALALSVPGTATAFVTEQLARVPADNAEIELDCSDMIWEAIFQDIVRRSASLRYVTAVSAFTCSKMRPDGFGGMAVLITADDVTGKSTSDIIADFLTEAGVDTGQQDADPSAAPARTL
ncbi:MAG TPA: hypothetical protein VGF34_21140 [Stellaceae bacterium]|jgi:hypothetical protein